jgi:dTDP-4-amino-4,6-dideoxygalactose transaminase
MAGGNSKCSEFHAAVGLAVLDVIGEKFAAKRRVSDLYDKYLESVSVSKLTPRESGYQVYPVLFSSTQARDKAMDRLAAADIGFRTYYVPLHTHPYFSRAKRGEMNVTEDIARRILCLPFYETLDERDVVTVVGSIRKALK